MLEEKYRKRRTSLFNKRKVNNFTLFVPCDVGMNCHKGADNVDSIFRTFKSLLSSFSVFTTVRTATLYLVTTYPTIPYS